MGDQSGTVVSILAFYVSLIALLSSLFFIQLGAWFRETKKTQQKWTLYKTTQERDKHIECYLEASDQKSVPPALGFGLITLFIVIVGYFAEQLRPMLSQQRTLENVLFVPGYLFFVIYVVASVIYLFVGYRTAIQLHKESGTKLDEG